MQRASTHPWLLLALSVAAFASFAWDTRAASQSPEESVRPGVNERFLSKDLDVDRFEEVFEGESREIFVQRAALTAALRLSAGMSVADIGAGTGLFEPLLSEAVGENGRVYAVDISPRFIEHLQERVKRQRLDNVDVVLGGERRTKLAARSVDVVFICDTYHHFEFPRTTLADLYDVIRPGGSLVIVDFERIPGVTAQWILDHVRADKSIFRAEIEAAGFDFTQEVEVPGLKENYVLRFTRPANKPARTKTE